MAASVATLSWDVFVSYKQTDSSKEFLCLLEETLCGIGVKPWIDKNEMNRANGAYMPEEMQNGINSSRVFLVLGTSEYAEALKVDTSPCRQEVRAPARCMSLEKKIKRFRECKECCDAALHVLHLHHSAIMHDAWVLVVPFCNNARLVVPFCINA
jgi:TIR domain